MKKIFFICMSFFAFFAACSQQKALKGKFVSRIEDVQDDSTYLLLSNGKLYRLGFGDDSEILDVARTGRFCRLKWLLARRVWKQLYREREKNSENNNN